MGSVETYPKIFEKEGHGSHLPGAAMCQRDESLRCTACDEWDDVPPCSNVADRYFVEDLAKYDDRRTGFKLFTACPTCFELHMDVTHPAIFEVYSLNEFIAFQVMNS
jgi:hypothetical protein